MKRDLIAIIATLVFLFFIATIGTGRTSAQQPTPPPSTPVPVPTSALERRIDQLEVAQTQTIESLKSSNQYNQFLITVVSGIIALLVAIQGLTSFSQARREKGRDRTDRTGVEKISNILGIVEQTLQSRAHREEERDRIDSTGVEKVSKILDVVEKTLDSRFLTEKQAREEAKAAKEELQKVVDQFKALKNFYETFLKTIAHARQAIEDRASHLAQTSRHDFRQKISEIDSFAQQFDAFKAQYEDFEIGLHKFTARTLYIRGITAHYANQPDIAKLYLTEVVSTKQPEAGEIESSYKRRVANAYYYLGVTESNFGNHQEAIDSFEKANNLDPQGTDFLTRIVTAEAYIMIHELDKAKQFITEIEEKLRVIERTEGRLRSFHLRLRSRAALVRANMVILDHKDDWYEETQKLLEMAHDAEPQYYYATSTLAQIHAAQNASEKAKKLFCEAYESIEHSNDLLTVNEARSRILLLMVAGMCCKHGLLDEKRAEGHLDRADGLRGNLPKMGPQVCTVFSTLSKRNENSEAIGYHIELIRKGQVLLGPVKE